MSGYFPEASPNLAVLAVKSFEVFVQDGDVQSSNTVRLFLVTAQAAGKTKLMIDLCGDPGRNVVLEYVSRPIFEEHIYLLSSVRLVGLADR